MRILKRVYFDSSKHVRTGVTKHTVFGKELKLPPAYMQIVSFDEDPGGFYLIHYDEKGDELTDTYHDSVDLATEQAEMEYGIRKHEWENVNN